MINKLKAEIQELEDKVLPEMTKDELYDLLVLAYFKAKDIIAILETDAPVVNVDADAIALQDIEVQDLREAYNLASTQVDIYKEEAAVLGERNKAVELILTQIRELIN